MVIMAVCPILIAKNIIITRVLPKSNDRKACISLLLRILVSGDLILDCMEYGK